MTHGTRPAQTQIQIHDSKKYTKNTKTKLNLTNKQTNIGINAKPGLSLSICRFSQGPRFAVNGEKFC